MTIIDRGFSVPTTPTRARATGIGDKAILTTQQVAALKAQRRWGYRARFHLPTCPHLHPRRGPCNCEET